MLKTRSPSYRALQSNECQNPDPGVCQNIDLRWATSEVWYQLLYSIDISYITILCEKNFCWKTDIKNHISAGCVRKGLDLCDYSSYYHVPAFLLQNSMLVPSLQLLVRLALYPLLLCQIVFPLCICYLSCWSNLFRRLRGWRLSETGLGVERRELRLKTLTKNAFDLGPKLTEQSGARTAPSWGEQHMGV